MKIVVAPDSFKGSLSAPFAAETMIKGCSAIYPDAKYCPIPLADGGEGTVDALVGAYGGYIIHLPVRGARMNEVEGFYAMLSGNQTAVIEVAAVCGSELLPATLRNPKLTTTYGVGELILAALDEGAQHIIIGLGDTVTNDAGMGMLQALGAQFMDAKGDPLPSGGGSLGLLTSMDFSGLEPRLKTVKLEVAYDVSNKLCGPNGASFAFGAQRGADQKSIIELDNALNHFAKRYHEYTGTDLFVIEGGGAAGGLGAALGGILGASLIPGVDLLMDALGMNDALQGADLVITGEGRLDGHSAAGKTPAGVAKRAAQYGVPVVAIGGSLGRDFELLYEQGIQAIFSCVNRADSLESILASAEDDLKACARNVAALYKSAHIK